MFTIKYRVRFTEPILGTTPGNKETMRDFIASKNPKGIDLAEVDAVPEVEEEIKNSTTFFSRTPDGQVMLWDYQIKGFFKSACQAMIESGALTVEVAKKQSLTKWTFKRTIDQQLFVTPRMVPIHCTGDVEFKERPLRASTMQGERIALARSEMVVGGEIEFSVSVLRENLLGVVDWAMNYGALSGMGQWRNSGMGRFLFEVVE